MLQPGDDVEVSFDGEICQGEVLQTHNGWILAKVLIDPDVDFGSVTSNLGPVSTVMVRDKDVRPL